jgi:hypothetical protein
MYRAYYGTHGCGEPRGLDRDRWAFKEFVDLPEALLWARRVVMRGGAVISIDGDDGTRLSRTDIAACLRRALD